MPLRIQRGGYRHFILFYFRQETKIWEIMRQHCQHQLSGPFAYTITDVFLPWCGGHNRDVISNLNIENSKRIATHLSFHFIVGTVLVVLQNQQKEQSSQSPEMTLKNTHNLKQHFKKKNATLNFPTIPCGFLSFTTIHSSTAFTQLLLQSRFNILESQQ